MSGVCMCVCGPPRGGVCSACGAFGEGYRPPTYAPNREGQSVGAIVFNPLTEEDVRRIIREELARVKLS